MTSTVAFALSPGRVGATLERDRGRRSGRSREAMSTMARDPRTFDVARAYRDHGPAIFGFAVNAVRDRSLAEECLQETFVRAWRHRERFDERRGSERTWLFTIARRVLVDLIRSRDRRTALVVRAGDPVEHDGRPMEQAVDRLALVEALARLTDAHREAVVAVTIGGASYQDVSDRTGVPVATLRTRMFHALRALRTHLQEEDDDDR